MSRPSAAELSRQLVAGDRAALARAITLVESRRPDDRTAAQELIRLILSRTGGARRIGISGAPGAGKSTFIDALGIKLVESGYRVAVLAVDPSSTVSGGSILGDKSRMARLAQDERAFIRPSPSAGTLGGVAAQTRESMLLCEAAGYDVVIVETVGVGQSETMVADMVDFFLLLVIPGAGDELQGIKRGIVEVADAIAVNKADGDNLASAKRAQSEYGSALRYLVPASSHWAPVAVTVSALTGQGLDELWTLICDHRASAEKCGAFEHRRRAQRVRWMWSQVEDSLITNLRENPRVAERLPALEAAVAEGTTQPGEAAAQLLKLLRGGA